MTNSGVARSSAEAAVPWQSLGGVLTSGPDAVSWTTGHHDVFVRGTDNALWHNWFDTHLWRGWHSLGAQFTSDPAANSSGNVETGPFIRVFVRGTDNALWHKAFGG
jgi:hypothetical protein